MSVLYEKDIDSIYVKCYIHSIFKFVLFEQLKPIIKNLNDLHVIS